MKPWEWDSEKLRKMFKEKSPNPSVEQMAWATMAIGRFAPIIHRKPKKRFWIFLIKDASHDAETSYMLTQALAGLLAERENNAR